MTRGKVQPKIGSGGLHHRRRPSTPPGVRVRTGRFAKTGNCWGTVWRFCNTWRMANVIRCTRLWRIGGRRPG